MGTVPTPADHPRLFGLSPKPVEGDDLDGFIREMTDVEEIRPFLRDWSRLNLLIWNLHYAFLRVMAKMRRR